ncbi:hypothetical protein RFI_32737 [Reticulomyxa filosa]|uniref:Uncharacterized protein n=1 Tax=Reticulomyxa filosa TaxID=46433 RepID=X6LTD9_RETFI|nr:hypothetical protein RFI_32737 [Reticulomyxa filosa]|eukprot:ETO04661.1 hypothetical protein RFI_32737 [Reticulomyxa filosa]
MTVSHDNYNSNNNNNNNNNNNSNTIYPSEYPQREVACETVVFLRKNFRQVLYYNLILSVLASLVSFFALWFWPKKKNEDRWYIPFVDYTFAVFTTFTMLGRNRACFQKECHCRCLSSCHRRYRRHSKPFHISSTSHNNPLQGELLTSGPESLDMSQPVTH